MNFDLRVGHGCFCHRLGTGKLLFPHYDIYLLRILGKENRLFRSGKSAAYDKDIHTGKKLSIAGGAVRDSSATKFHLTLKPDLSRACSCRQDHAQRPESAFVRDSGFHIAFQIQGLYFRLSKFRAKIFRLFSHIVREVRAVRFQHSRIIYNFGGDGDLSSDLLFLDHQHAILCSCQIDSGGESSRTAANDNTVVKFHVIFHNHSFRETPIKGVPQDPGWASESQLRAAISPGTPRPHALPQTETPGLCGEAHPHFFQHYLRSLRKQRSCPPDLR